MSQLKNSVLGASIFLGIFISSIALAHTKLISSTPSEGDDVTDPTVIELHFSNDLVPQFSKGKLVMVDDSGSNVSVDVNVSNSDDKKTLLLMPASHLLAGNYRLEWRVVSSDSHPVLGHLSFEVK
ncbi:copper homeostasis periplasmic binding protein CopC [Pseudomonas sp. AP-1]|uniref:copper homeostasis periplasmic binding protein CopC n=1 Tax=Pseudomonas sp. AP-1 TaxID=3231718 RepID=UPI001029CD0F|nr:copper resistance protein CopC [Pseudomonas moorei]